MATSRQRRSSLAVPIKGEFGTRGSERCLTSESATTVAMIANFLCRSKVRKLGLIQLPERAFGPQLPVYQRAWPLLPPKKVRRAQHGRASLHRLDEGSIFGMMCTCNQPCRT
eukprot:scaffold2636_cov340-Pavlova_lutheri.AAC.135